MKTRTGGTIPVFFLICCMFINIAHPPVIFAMENAKIVSCARASGSLLGKILVVQNVSERIVEYMFAGEASRRHNNKNNNNHGAHNTSNEYSMLSFGTSYFHSDDADIFMPSHAAVIASSAGLCDTTGLRNEYSAKRIYLYILLLLMTVILARSGLGARVSSKGARIQITNSTCMYKLGFLIPGRVS